MTEAFRQGFVDTMQKIAASTGYIAPKVYRPEQLGLQADDLIHVRPSLPSDQSIYPSSYPSYVSSLINKNKPITIHDGRLYAYEGNISDLAKTMNDSGTAKPVPAVKPRKTPYERRMAPGVASRSAG